jgi:hypothetical protein
MIVYGNAIFDTNKVELDGKKFDVIFGKHEFYLPELQEKLIFSVRGKIVSYGYCIYKNAMIADGRLFSGLGWEEKYLKSIVNEYSLLKYLAEKKLTPPVGDLIFIKKVWSNLDDYGILDEVGMFGYEMKDAYTLSPGHFDVEVVNDMVNNNIIQASPGALNDLTNTDRKNLVNGYCIDVRRSFRDDLPFYNNFQFNGEVADILDEIRSVLNG